MPIFFSINQPIDVYWIPNMCMWWLQRDIDLRLALKKFLIWGRIQNTWREDSGQKTETIETNRSMKSSEDAEGTASWGRQEALREELGKEATLKTQEEADGFSYGSQTHDFACFRGRHPKTFHVSTWATWQGSTSLGDHPRDMTR